MSKSGWIVHSQDKSIGPISAAEVRDGLRNGTIDPFDYVSQPGSQIRIPLIEADEIFEHIIPPGAEDLLASPTQSAFEELVSKSHGQNVFGNKFSSSGRDSETLISQTSPGANARPRRFEALAVNSKPSSSSLDANRHDLGVENIKRAKKYFLKDKDNKALGPLSAQEILSLWLRGSLPAGVQVEKLGANAQVPLQQFVAAYLRAKNPAQKGHFERARNFTSGTALRMRAKIAGSASTMPNRFLLNFALYAIAVFAIAGSAIALYHAFFVKPQVSLTPNAQPTPQSETVNYHAPNTIAETPLQSDKNESIKMPHQSIANDKNLDGIEQTINSKNPQGISQTQEVHDPQPISSSISKQIRINTKNKSRKNAQKRKSNISQPPKNPQPTSPLTPEKLTRSTVENKSIVETNSLQKQGLGTPSLPQPTPGTKRLNPSPKPSPKSSLIDPKLMQHKSIAMPPSAQNKPLAPSPPMLQPKAVTSSKQPNPPSVAMGSLVNGKTVTIGPYTYNPISIETCGSIKCKLPMDGPNGPIVVVFFKAAYGPALSRRKGKAFLTGRPDNSSGVTLFFLEGVR